MVDEDFHTNVPEIGVTSHQGEGTEMHHEVAHNIELLENSASDIINTTSVLQEEEEGQGRPSQQGELEFIKELCKVHCN